MYTYPWEWQKQDAEIEHSIKNRKGDGRLESKRTVLRNTSKRAPIGSKVQAAIEDEAKEEGDGESNGENDEHERGPLETRPCEDATVQEQESEFREADSQRLHDENHVHTLFGMLVEQERPAENRVTNLLQNY